LIEKTFQGVDFAILADKDHATGYIIEHNRQIKMTFADGYFVHGQDAQPG
jgi:hypothetical protein